MEVALSSKAEELAKEAELLPAFSGISLLHIKRQVADLLSLIGRDGIFDEYTVHDISHIDAMLKLFEWLIPGESIALMTPADWLIAVLSVYFHDLGMLVTKQEFEKRDQSDFRSFCQSILFEGDSGIDYRQRLEDIQPERRERFLYQEFVRYHHGIRIKN